MLAAVPSPQLIEEMVTIDGIPTFVRRRDGEGPPTVFVHGNPTNSDDWLDFMEALPGPSLAFDLPCFGRSARSPEFAADMDAYDAFIESALDRLGVAEHQLVVHDWGGIALPSAARHPDRVRRLVVINTVPLFREYKWHWVARIWRRRVQGELFNLATPKPLVYLALLLARGRPRSRHGELTDLVTKHLDAGMKRAILALYRSAEPARLAEAGKNLGALRCPALVLWGDRDPYLGAEWGRAYADALPGAELEEIPGAGHWPWYDDPAVVDRVVGFLS